MLRVAVREVAVLEAAVVGGVAAVAVGVDFFASFVFYRVRLVLQALLNET